MTVYFRPCGDITRAPEPRGPGDLDLIRFISDRTGLAIEIDASVDYEDWMEPACLLEQALRSGLEVSILPRKPLHEAVEAPVVVVSGEQCRDILIGRLLQRDPQEYKYFDFGWPVRRDALANHYAELKTFQKRAGRRMRLADMPGDRASAGDRVREFDGAPASTSLGDAMASLAPGTVLVKQVYPAKKLPILTYVLEADFNAGEAENQFFNDTGFHAMLFEGDPAALLVQEKITMTHETRFIVIDGKVVSGGACIESDTPQTNRSSAAELLPRWEVERNSGDLDQRGLEVRQALARRLWSFACETAEEIRAEAPGLDAYALDLALDAQGMPLIIELNPCSSCGLYSNNAERLFTAIRTHAELAPGRDPEPLPEAHDRQDANDFDFCPFVE